MGKIVLSLAGRYSVDFWRLHQRLKAAVWKITGRRIPLPYTAKEEIIKKCAAKFGIKTLVETGTYFGGTVLAGKDVFKKIYSVELDEKLFQNAAARFAGYPHIRIVRGDSAEVLAGMLADVHEPCLFWLDAHYSGSVTSGKEKGSPVMTELRQIFSLPAGGHVILIDDARHFTGENGYSTIAEILDYVRSQYPESIFKVEDDIIKICPAPKATAEPALTDKSVAKHSQPLVSVIIPAYNAEAFLSEALESVRRQTYPNWEIVAVDDGSRDATAAIAKSYAAKDSRIKYVWQENKRMAAARNAGIRQAQGKYVAFLDADNLFLPDKLTRQVDYMENHPDCGLVYSNILHFYNDRQDEFYTHRNDRPLSEPDQFLELLHRNCINVLAVLVRKEALDRWGAFMEGWRACDEHYVWINLAYHGIRFDHAEEITGLSRLHRKSDSRRKDHIFDTAEKFLELLDIFESDLRRRGEKKYEKQFRDLRRSWRLKLFIGRLLKAPFFSALLLPLYFFRRERGYFPHTGFI